MRFSVVALLAAAVGGAVVQAAATARVAQPMAPVRRADGDGVKIDVTWPVKCDRKSRQLDTISVAYNLTLADGTKIESTEPGSSFQFTLGIGDVIPGWDIGLKDMCIGERRTLTLPPAYGYGNRSNGPIPANSTLVFYTELKGIQGVPNPSRTVSTPVIVDQ